MLLNPSEDHQEISPYPSDFCFFSSFDPIGSEFQSNMNSFYSDKEMNDERQEAFVKIKKTDNFIMVEEDGKNLRDRQFVSR